MRYGYESQWFGDDAIKQNITTASDRFFRSLKRDREDTEPLPLIMIAHGFDGLVVLKALLRAQQFPDKWPGIFPATVGLVFLGTPFRGASGITQTEMIRAIQEMYKDTVQAEVLRIHDPDDKHCWHWCTTLRRSRRETLIGLMWLATSSKNHAVSKQLWAGKRRRYLRSPSSGTPFTNRKDSLLRSMKALAVSIPPRKSVSSGLTLT